MRCRFLERCDLGLRQFPPPTQLQMMVANRTDCHARQVVDGMTDGLEHLSHLPIPSFANRDAKRCAPFLAAGHYVHLRRSGSTTIDRHTAREPIEIVRVRYTEDACFVHTRDAVARMRQPRREVTVVGQEQQPFRIEVQASNWIDVFADAAEQIDDRRTLLWIGSCRHVSARLVQEEITVSFRQLDAPTVDANVIARWFGLRTELAHGDAVDRDATLEHQLL